MTPALPLTPQVFAILGALIEERSGLHYELRDLDLVADRIGTRAIEAGFDSALDYYYFLRYDEQGPAEMDRLIDALVVNETYFFREAEQLRILVDVHLAPLIAAGDRPRVWCAACSTGEEPLTLAMLLDERGLLGRCSILATDVSTRALARARDGQYGGRALRAVPAGVAGRWLDVAGDKATVRPRVRDAIDLQRLNLVDPVQIAALGSFDAVICRNVLIYFRDDTVQRVVAAIAGVLRPQGCLLVGASESLLRFGTAFECEEKRGAFFYVKQAPG